MEQATMAALLELIGTLYAQLTATNIELRQVREELAKLQHKSRPKK